MKKGKTKLMATAVMLLLSLLMLAGASLAWFTISTSPEISGMQVTVFTNRALLISDTGEIDSFTQSINLSEKFAYYASLKPISTVDGKYWFIPTYDEVTGAIKPVNEFILATAENANVPIYETDDQGNYTTLKTGIDLFNAQKSGYYVFCDFWLATEYDTDVSVTLSVPGDHLEAWEEDEDHPHGARYGSYALASYAMKGDNVYTIDNNAQTALRIGFLTNKDTDDERFVIWEPNADQRSDIVKPEDGSYIHGFTPTINPAYESDNTQPKYLNYKSNSYIPTLPIRATFDEDGNVNGAEVTPLAEIDPTNMIVQMAGKWNLTKVQERIRAGKKINSNHIDLFGNFVKDSSVLKTLNDNGIVDFEQTQPEMGLASNSIIVTLKGRDPETGNIQPQKVTMFIWIEGQDPDCWNDIADGTFIVNIEFAAQP